MRETTREERRDICSLLAENTSEMKDGVAHSGMELAKLSGLSFPFVPVVFIETRPASSQIHHTLPTSGSHFQHASGSENGMSSHGLLLRLFLSQGFFSVLRALQYTRTYSDNIGITHYLCSRLDAVPTDELADKWLLIWCVDASL